jgi:DUF438 domain-containing protein
MLSPSEEKMPGEIPETIARSVLSALPVDITFIDKNNVIRYYSEYRIFNRTPDILGSAVRDCHSPASRAAVDKVIEDLKSGRAQVVEQHTTKGGRPVLVRYFAVRSQSGEYQGLVEMCQWLNKQPEKKKPQPPPYR